MKALQLVPAMRQGGVESYVVQLDRILRGARWENVVVSRGGPLADALVARGGRHVALDLKSKNPLTYLSRAAKLRRLVLAERPDVVCAHSRVPAWLAVRALRGLGVRFLTFAHGANSISRYSRVMTRGDLVMCPSTFVRDYLERAYGTPRERFRVVPHAVDAKRFDPARTDASAVAALKDAWGVAGRRVVMSVGRITRLKGLDTLIRATAMLPKEFMLVVVGGADGDKEDYLAELRALVSERALDDRVVFAGARADVPACLAVADVVVSGNTAKPETFGLSMVEALAMERPVVAKAFGGALDIVRDGVDGFLVRPESGVSDERAFAEAIFRCAGRRFGNLRRDALARFDFDIMSRRTLAVYEEAAKTGIAEAEKTR